MSMEVFDTVATFILNWMPRLIALVAVLGVASVVLEWVFPATPKQKAEWEKFQKEQRRKQMEFMLRPRRHC